MIDGDFFMKASGLQTPEGLAERKRCLKTQDKGDPKCSLLKAHLSKDGGGGEGCRYSLISTQKLKGRYTQVAGTDS